MSAGPCFGGTQHSWLITETTDHHLVSTVCTKCGAEPDDVAPTSIVAPRLCPPHKRGTQRCTVDHGDQERPVPPCIMCPDCLMYIPYKDQAALVGPPPERIDAPVLAVAP